MHQSVEEYVKRKRNEFLIQEGLTTASSGLTTREVPIEVTDEEYAAIREAYFLAKPKEAVDKNKIAIALKVIAWIDYIGGIILGIVSSTEEHYYSTDFSFETAIVYWSIAILSGTLILAFSEIISLLHEINHK